MPSGGYVPSSVEPVTGGGGAEGGKGEPIDQGGGGDSSGMLAGKCPKGLPWWLIPLAALGVGQTLAAILARK